jgi:hypothetical protein
MFDNKNIWRNISTFQSASFTQNYLYKQYEKQGFSSPESLSYENCYRFIYYLEHGQKYYIQTKSAPIDLQPVLLFYGMIQLLKACLLTIDPLYPENSQVLAHGVSTRKRKKAQYEFLRDEVKIQKNGLLSHFSDKMFHVKHFEGEKYTMKMLLKLIPELHHLFHSLEATELSYKVSIPSTKKLHITNKILDDYHISARSFTHFLSSRNPLITEEVAETNECMIVSLKKTLSPLSASPLLFDFTNEHYYILKKKEDCLTLPEIVVHYLLLATSYSHRGKPPTTIGAEELNDRVRHGNECDLFAIATRQY